MTSPLRGGTRRRRRAPMAVGALVTALVATAAIAWAALGGPSPGHGGGGSLVAGAGAAPPDPAASPGTAPGSVPPAPGSSDAVRHRFGQPPRGGVLFDVRTGQVLWRHQPTRVLPIASLTKVMTAVLVVDRTSARERVLVTRRALGYSGSGVGVLPRGKRVPVDALLHGLLLVSGNDAAIALAQHVGGSEAEFVALMNQRARQLGLRCTRFATPHGLSGRDRSCPADLAALARVAVQRRRIARAVRKKQAAVPFPIEGGRLYLNNTNPLMRGGYRGTIGLKTGYTRRAGRNYIAVVRRGRRTLGVVLLHSPDPAAQAKKLLDRGFRVPAGR